MKKIIPFLVLLILFSCNQKQTKSALTNPFIIQKDSFITILADVQIIEAGLRKQALPTGKLQKLSNQYYESLFKEHQISKQRFDSSLSYYKQDMIEFEKMYLEVVTLLKEKKKVIVEE